MRYCVAGNACSAHLRPWSTRVPRWQRACVQAAGTSGRPPCPGQAWKRHGRSQTRCPPLPRRHLRRSLRRRRQPQGRHHAPQCHLRFDRPRRTRSRPSPTKRFGRCARNSARTGQHPRTGRLTTVDAACACAASSSSALATCGRPTSVTCRTAPEQPKQRARS